MDTSLFLAQAFGIYFIVMGLMMFRSNVLRTVIDSFAQNSALKFITGIFILIPGILLVLVHNIWEGETWQIIITVLAWLTLIKGVFYLLVPQSIYMGLVRILNSKGIFFGAGILVLVLGGWFVRIGFGL